MNFVWGALQALDGGSEYGSQPEWAEGNELRTQQTIHTYYSDIPNRLQCLFWIC